MSLVDLRGQLPGRGQDEGARGAPRLAEQPVEDGQDEGGGLAAARHGAAEHVAALHDGRDGLVLDGRGLHEAEVVHAAQAGRDGDGNGRNLK